MHVSSLGLWALVLLTVSALGVGSRTCTNSDVILPELAPRGPRTVTPFGWTIAIRFPNGKEKAFEPGPEPQALPALGDWKCRHTGLSQSYDQAGNYSEYRDFVCERGNSNKVMVGGRTACLRDSNGVMHPDRQLLVVADRQGVHKVMIRCEAQEGVQDIDPNGLTYL